MTLVGYRRLLVWLVIGLLCLVIYTVGLHITESYASKEVAGLQRWRDEALRSDVPHAVEILGWMDRDRPSGTDTPLERIRSIQWTNVTQDIVAYLRTKTGDDLGGELTPWIEKYGTKKQ